MFPAFAVRRCYTDQYIIQETELIHPARIEMSHMVSDQIPSPAPVTLREINGENLPAILELEVSQDQLEHYPRSNAYSIAQAHFAPDTVDPDYDGLLAVLSNTPQVVETLELLPEAWFRGIYAGETPVGFVMLSLVPEKAEYFVWRLMIDRSYQGHGYGYRAMREVIDFVKTLPDARLIYIAHMDGNEGMAHLCQKLGFRYTGEEIAPGDLLMVMEL